VLGEKAGVDWQGIAYKAIGNAWSDLYGGAINFMFVDLTAARGQVVAKKVRTLAISLPERSPLYPDVPTLSESYPGFVSTGFLAIAVPKAVPEPIKQRLNVLINEAIFSPEINKRLVEEFALTPRKLDLAQCAAAGPRGARQVGRLREDREDPAAVISRKKSGRAIANRPQR
jgi:tripartite-type tricarboxylate transporter receptor subunit TctC